MRISGRSVQVRLLDLASLPVLSAYLWGGVMSLAGGPPSAVHAQLGAIIGAVWSVMLICGPLLSIGSFPLADQRGGIWLRVGAGWFTVGALGIFTGCAYVAYGPSDFITILGGGLAGAALLVLVLDTVELWQWQRGR